MSRSAVERVVFGEGLDFAVIELRACRTP